ncbi:Uncharacterised protein [Mycobacteroides abscessus subsp. abscessus]|nr:Uncharacterised protein [Mycobacteroides abscessus subsp. abscessus]
MARSVTSTLSASKRRVVCSELPTRLSTSCSASLAGLR